MCKNLRLLRSITKSHSHHETSVLLDASHYIQELKRKLENIDQAVLAGSLNLIEYDSIPMLKVEEQEKGFLTRISSRRSCHGLLAFILEAFEELGLDVLSARVNCVDGFCLEAVGAKEDNDEEANHMDAQVVQRHVSQAIQNWMQVTSSDNPAST
ncbi:uncharacterized protein LOC114759808 [Neltuma alba]|uniref:uncharacterized protein LOC114759808 n=1 Tax=Neltuma alba TaxID=207710 RepID=UPI0010A559A5|nr:uncharacterized protein LOC114759808 [Prosopis alba]